MEQKPKGITNGDVCFPFSHLKKISHIYYPFRNVSMYFLNGDRIYINPEKACGTMDEQLENCFAQLSKINSGQKIFKLSFFAETNSKAGYEQLQNKIRNKIKNQFSYEVITTLIAQPPLSSKIIVEACFYREKDWDAKFIKGESSGAVLFKRDNAEILIGSAQAYSNYAIKINTEKAFAELIDIFNEAYFPINAIVRQWNYVENILGFDGESQRYQEFNDVRSGVYGNTFTEKGYPSATGIGMNQGGVIIEFIAVKSGDLISFPIDNPNQISAHTYSEKVLVGAECVLKTTPKFERARFIELFGKKLIFVSGTASIVGEKTVGVGNAEEQTEVTINNIKQLYSPEVLENLTGAALNPQYGHARVYVKNKRDYSVIRKTFKRHFGSLPVVYIIADICRDDLLVEIEGKVILEKS
ncbi:MAG: hypothetical protein R2757_11275 [Draconibacterium sp.]